ncbi:hypothetical protein DFH08DRAFT_712402, partial [Mycena albidolilacea]
PFLLSVGYKLRPRYDPNWVPSWWNSTERRREGELPEDGYQLYSLSCISLDGKGEFRCIQCPLNFKYDPRNRAIPVLQTIPLPNGLDVLVVMPYGRQFNHPAFHCRAEFVEAMRQLLEVCTRRLPFSCIFTASAAGPCILPRLQYLPLVRACSSFPTSAFDCVFGISMRFPKGKDTDLTTGTLRTFPMIPELSLTVPYNPFKVDIFQLRLTMANVIKVCFSV